MRAWFYGGVAVVSCLGVLGCQSSSANPAGPTASNEVSAAAPLSRVSRVVAGLAPDAVRTDLFSGQLDRAIRKAFRVPGDPTFLRGLVGDLVVVPIGTRVAGTYTFPNPEGNQVSVPTDVSVATFTLNIALADKLAVGKTLGWRFYFSSDNGQTWVFRNGGGWTSYGPGGFTNHLGVVNPDPVLTVGVFDQRGKLIRGEIRLDQQTDIGVTITTQ